MFNIYFNILSSSSYSAYIVACRSNYIDIDDSV